MVVRSHVRKFWNALYKEIKDTSLDNRVRSSKLFLVNIIYAEDYMTQFLDHIIRNLIWHSVAKNKDENIIAENI